MRPLAVIATHSLRAVEQLKETQDVMTSVEFPDCSNFINFCRMSYRWEETDDQTGTKEFKTHNGKQSEKKLLFLYSVEV